MKQMNLAKRIGGTIMLPLAMFIVMFIVCYANGKTYFGTLPMWRIVLSDTAVATCCALGIGLQFKSGRFDFSGGAIMLLTAIIAGHVAQDMAGNNITVFMILCLLVSVVLSIIVSLVYVFGRLPIVIATIGMALLYESITCIVFNGAGAKYVANMTLNVFASFPKALIPLVACVLIYAIYSYGTVTGKEAQLLANNQQSAVNIGINEKKNVIVSYIFSGLIFGFATMIYAAKAPHDASFTSLSTAGELFSNILPVFIGLMLAGFCGDLIGTFMGALTLSLLSYSLSAIFTAEMGSAISTVITGLFILLLNVVAGQGATWIAGIKKVLKNSSRAMA